MATGHVFYKREWDTLEPIEEILRDSLGVPIPNLSSAEAIHFHLWNQRTGAAIINTDVSGIDDATSKVTYEWTTEDVAAMPRGTYGREWHIIWGPDVEQRVPSGDDLYPVIVTPAGVVDP